MIIDLNEPLWLLWMAGVVASAATSAFCFGRVWPRRDSTDFRAELDRVHKETVEAMKRAASDFG